MKKFRKIGIALVAVILIVISVILSLSNTIGANGYIGGVDAKITDISQCNTTTKLAWFVANYPEKFMAATNDDIFGIKRLSVVHLQGTHDVYYYTCACMYHTQQTETPDGTVRPENVILLETPGKITVYDKENPNTPVVVDLNDFDTAEKIYKNIYGQNATFTEEEHKTMKFNLSMFTYAVQQLPPEEENVKNGYGSWSPTSGLNSTEDIIKFYWWKKDVQEYVKASGILNDSFSHDQGWGLSAVKTHAKYKEVVEKIIETPSLEIQEITTGENNTKVTPTIEYKDGKAYIGPLKAIYSGGTPSIQVGGVEVNWVTKQNGAYSQEETSSEYVSGQEFYAVLDEETAKGLTNITVDIKLDYQFYKSKLALFKNGTEKGQCLMYHAGEKTEDSIKDSWTVENGDKLQIQKQDANGNNLNIAGIKFEVYNSENQLVGTLITDGTGKTNSLPIGENKEYTIKETENSAYGYKGCVITEAEIVSGNGTISVNDGKVKINITEDTVISIKNEPKFGQIAINKKGDIDDNPLANVEFILWQGSKFVQLKDNNGNIVESVTGEVTVNTNNIVTGTGYQIEYIEQEEMDNATKFKTDDSGNIVINNVEIYLNSTEKYEYWLYETSNDNQGYKGMTISQANVTVTGGTILNIDSNSRGIKFSIDEKAANIELNIQNNLELGFIELEKVGEDGTNLANVEFIIQREENEYLQLKDSEGKVIPTIKGNEANNIMHQVTYVAEKESATVFITDESGKVRINDLEINKSATKKYSYTAHEIYNPNYGYGSKQNVELTATVTELKLNETTQVKITNIQELGNLQLKKYDESNNNIVLADVGFVIELTPSVEKNYGYLALYNQNGELVQSVKGIVTINAQNEVKEITTGIEYKVSYYYTEKAYSELTDEEKANITTFLTGDSGILTVNNLEVYSPKTSDKYVYKLIEISNANYGFVAESEELGNIILESDKTKYEELANRQKYTKMSGYVWIENSAGKSNEYDGVYTNGELSSDIKLTDLYIMKDGQLVKNPEAVTPVEIKLRNKVTGETIKAQPDEFDADGRYTFNDVEVSELANYEVVFVYDGFYYTTVVQKLDKDNGSKVKEAESEREALSNKFATIKDNSEVVATDGTINTVEYHKDGHTSTVSKLFDTKLSANTSEAGYNLKEELNALKSQAVRPVKEIENVNMGIVLREQPKISINSDIYSVLIDFEGYKYNYKYNGRQNYYENKNGDDIGVKFELEYTTQRYTRPVYASDIQAAKDQNKEIKLSITYKIQIANESRTLSVMPKQIINYFDAKYDIKAVGLEMDETTHTVANTLTYSEAQSVQDNSEYKSTKIDFNQLIGSGNENVKHLYITFDVQRDAILGLLNNKSTYHNASEILSYACYYGEDTSKVDGVQFTTDQTEAGKLYAGIDKASQPGNMEIKLIDHPTEAGTKILDTTNFEDDTTSAPSLLLEASESRQISGTIFEDVATNTIDNQKLGDGIYNEGEKPVSGVKVELYKVDENGQPTNLATYSNGEQVTAITDESGSYIFGYYDESNNKYVGVLPGRYVIKYTYNNESYIVGNRKINLDDYKSTIITSQVIKNAFEAQDERWFTVKEENRYSDARDDISLRPEYNPNVDNSITITNSTYNNQISIEYMNAYTPIMDIGIEFTPENSADITFNRIIKLENVDFGIVERPDVDITVEKEITGLEIVAQNGTVIIPNGNPSDPNTKMQYVKALDGLVSVEIESQLLQGAELSLEYTISVVNNSDKDYLEPEYYYYGTGGITETTSRVKQVVDYLDATMALELEQDQDIWKQVTAEELYQEGNGFISEETYNELKNGNYHVLTTEVFEEVGAGQQKSIKLYATRYLATSDSLREENKVEIIELTGKRTIKDSIPGDYIPSESPQNQDEDKVDLVITPPTGSTVNYILYAIAAVATSVILVLGIVIIKKKIVK